MTTRALGLALLLALASCAAPDRLGPAAGDDPLVLAPGHLPTPYSAAAIRDANPPGTTRVFWIERGGAARTQTTTFEAGPEGRAAFVARTVGEDESERALQRGDATWAELQAHASFPASETTRRDATVTVGAGTFDCWLYERRADAEVHRFWFAKELPGPPVLYVATRDGAPFYRMELRELRRSP